MRVADDGRTIIFVPTDEFARGEAVRVQVRDGIEFRPKPRACQAVSLRLLSPPPLPHNRRSSNKLLMVLQHRRPRPIERR